MPMNIILKKAIAVLAATTIVLAPMQAFAQTQDVKFYTGSGYGFEIPVDSGIVQITDDFQSVIKIADPKISKVLQAEIVSVDGEDVLFVQVQDGKNTPTKAFVSTPSSGLLGKFAG